VGGTHTVEDWTECALTQTGRQTKVKTVYLPVSLRSLGGYNYRNKNINFSHIADSVWKNDGSVKKQ